MQALVARALAARGPAACENHVGDVAWQRFQHTGREAEWRIRIWDEGWRARRVGVDPAPATLGHEIHPRHRGGALHDELLDWFEADAEGDELRASSLTTDPERLAFLRGRGYEIEPAAHGSSTTSGELADTARAGRARRLPAAHGRARRPRGARRAASGRLGALARHRRRASRSSRPCGRIAPTSTASWRRPTAPRRLLPRVARRREPRRASSSRWARILTTGAAASLRPCAASRSTGCARRERTRSDRLLARGLGGDGALRVDRAARARALAPAR